MNVDDRYFEVHLNELLNEDLTDESASEHDFAEENDNTDSEQSEREEVPDPNGMEENNEEVQEAGEDDEHSSSSDDNDEQPRYYYGKPQGKNKVRFKWFSKEPSRRGRPVAHNIVILPKVTGAVRALGSTATPSEIWFNFFTPETLNEIIVHTNTKLREIRSKYMDPTRVELRDVDFVELRAVMGLLYYGAVFKSNTEDLRSVYATDGSGREIFRFVMSHKRLEVILYCLRFDDITTRRERKESDKAAPISKVFNDVVSKFRSNYQMGALTCVDEMLCKFRGKCKFRMFMPKKPAKFGLKIMVLSDARTSYCYNAYLYTGKGSDGAGLGDEYKTLSIPSKAVVRLTECIFDTNRNVTADNWFSSIPLASFLLKKGLTYVGTLKKNKAEIPAAFQPNSIREVGSALFGFTKELTLVSFVPSEKKAVILVSSMHHDRSFDNEVKKPTIIMDYNMTKGGVDSLDKQCANYSTARKTHRWPMRILFALLDIVGVNSHVLYNSFKDNEEFYNRCDFMKFLSKELVTPHMQNRLAIASLQTELKLGICRVLDIEMPRNPPQHPQNPVEKSKRRRCYTCPGGRDRKTNIACQRCENPICNECANKFCRHCTP